MYHNYNASYQNLLTGACATSEIFKQPHQLYDNKKDRRIYIREIEV